MFPRTKTHVLALALCAVCGCQPQSERSDVEQLSITRPLRAHDLLAGRFVAYTILWPVAGPPGGDPVLFQTDGAVQNETRRLARHLAPG